MCSLAALLAPLPSGACSRLLWNTNGDLVVVGRSMDWDHSFEDMLYIVPRGAKMDGGIGDNPATWTVKYGSVTNAISGWLMTQGDYGSDAPGARSQLLRQPARLHERALHRAAPIP